VPLANHLKLPSQWIDQRVWQYGYPVLGAFAIAHGQHAALQVHVLDSQAERFEDTKAAAIEQARHQVKMAIKLGQHTPDLGARQDDGQPFRPGCANDSSQPRQAHFQHVFVQKQQGGQRLGLSCRSDMSLSGEM
jgi:hypothetical protein